MTSVALHIDLMGELTELAQQILTALIDQEIKRNKENTQLYLLQPIYKLRRTHPGDPPYILRSNGVDYQITLSHSILTTIDDREIPHRVILEKKTLGKGAFARVKVVDAKEGGASPEKKLSACKISLARNREKLELHSQRESALAYQVGLFGSSPAFFRNAKKGPKTYWFMEQLGDSLKQYIYSKTTILSLREIIQSAIEIVSCLVPTHLVGIVHGDLKPANILDGNDGRFVITDFGLACLRAEGLKPNNSGTLLYMPKEGWLKLGRNTSFDIFSFGAVLYEMLTQADLKNSLWKKRLVFDDKGSFSHVNWDESFDFSLLREKLKYLDPICVESLVKFLGDMLCDDPEQRMSAQEIFDRLTVFQDELGEFYTIKLQELMHKVFTYGFSLDDENESIFREIPILISVLSFKYVEQYYNLHKPPSWDVLHDYNENDVAMFFYSVIKQKQAVKDQFKELYRYTQLKEVRIAQLPIYQGVFVILDLINSLADPTINHAQRADDICQKIKELYARHLILKKIMEEKLLPEEVHMASSIKMFLI